MHIRRWEHDVYESFVLQTVACEDDTRAVWPSSPSAFRWKPGVYIIDGRPNSNPLQVQNDTESSLETHGPYQRGYSATYPGVSSMLTSNTYKTHIPPIFREHATRVQCFATFLFPSLGLLFLLSSSPYQLCYPRTRYVCTGEARPTHTSN